MSTFSTLGGVREPMKQPIPIEEGLREERHGYKTWRTERIDFGEPRSRTQGISKLRI